MPAGNRLFTIEMAENALFGSRLPHKTVSIPHGRRFLALMFHRETGVVPRDFLDWSLRQAIVHNRQHYQYLYFAL